MSSDTDSSTGSSFDQSLARIAAGGYNDMQEVRKSQMNRVRDIVRKINEGIPFDEVEDEKDPDEVDFDSKYDDDNLPILMEEMREDGTLEPYMFEYLRTMYETAQMAADAEDSYAEVMGLVESEPIYQEWLDNVYGVSTTLAAQLIHRFGYNEERDRVSQLWSYCGLAPGQERRRGEKLGYDPEAKTLAWLIADRMIMQGDRSRYKQEFYDPYKAEQIRRMEESQCDYCGEPTIEHDRNDTGNGVCPMDAEVIPDDGVTLSDFEIRGKDVPSEATPPWTRGHADARARRYLAKKFLKHFHTLSRDAKGLSTPDEYVLVHGDEDGEAHDKRTDTFENPYYARRELNDPTE